MSQQNRCQIVIITGVAGSGKTTLGKALAEKFSFKFIDADDFHSKKNKEKMARGKALQDEDRWEWLSDLNDLLRSSREDLILACSALKETYRRKLARGAKSRIQWVFIDSSIEIVEERLKERKDHFFKETILASQFEILEKPNYGVVVETAQELDQKLERIQMALAHPTSEMGILGLGIMGKAMARNLAGHGYRLSLFNRPSPWKEKGIAFKAIEEYPEFSQCIGFDDLNKFVLSLERPRKMILMINAGAVESVSLQLKELLDPRDIVVDGGNSFHEDTARRQKEFEEIGVFYLGLGVSGGEKGALYGPSLMCGGLDMAFNQVKGILETMAAKDDNGGSCCAFVGKKGAGHFTKMVHNAIEYAEMQLLAELYDYYRTVEKISAQEISRRFEEISAKGNSSYLIDITIAILSKREGSEFLVDKILDSAQNKGTGSWASIEACKQGVATPSLTSALFSRFLSARKDERLRFSQLFSSPERLLPQILTTDQISDAYQAARILNHHQGFKLLEEFLTQGGSHSPLNEIARIWTGGCIIRSDLMKELAGLLKGGADEILHDPLGDNLQKAQVSLRAFVSQCVEQAVPVPVFSACTHYFTYYCTAFCSANLLQAQRDYFGAHTYQRIDSPAGESFHTQWEA